MALISLNSEINSDTVLQRKSDVLFNEIDGEVVMLNIQNSEYYGMDRVGSRIWELLEQPHQFNELIMKLLNEYEVTEQQCIQDTLSFLDILLKKCIISINKV